MNENEIVDNEKKDTIEYKDLFSEILPEIVRLKADNKCDEAIANINKILNTRFETCIEVILTNNIDNLFFGIVTMPIVMPDLALSTFFGDENTNKIYKYKVEIDSKLLSDLYNLDVYEITALLIHEVHMLCEKNDIAIKNTRQIVDEYLTMNNQVLHITNASKLLNILQFMMQESIRRNVSIFYTEYVIPDKFDMQEGIDKYLNSSIRKLDKTSNMISRFDSATTVIKWCLRLYNDMLKYRIPALHILNKSIEVTGSHYIKTSMEKLKHSLNYTDDYILRGASNFNEATSSIVNFFNNSKKANLNALDRFKANGVKAYFDDFYELQFEVNNMDDDRGLAVMLLHKINSRMNVIDDYISTEDNLNPTTLKKLQELYDRYDSLRYSISSKKLKSPRTLLINYGDD